MAWDVRTWNLGGIVVLAAGCAGPLVPAGNDASSSATGETEGEGEGEVQGSVTTPSDEGPPPQCENDSECPIGFECRYGNCEYEYYCSTCCEDDCGNPEDSGNYGYECDDDFDCIGDEVCVAHVCVPGTPLPECGDGAWVVEPLPIPTGDAATNLAFVDGAPGERDRLVILGDTQIGVVAPDGTPTWSDALETQQSRRRVVVADFDGDGLEDVALAGIQDDVAGIATFTISDAAPAFIAFSPGETQNPDVGDFDGDGNADIVHWAVNVGHAVSPGVGDGSFAPEVATGLAEVWIWAVDVDGDGREEIVGESGAIYGLDASFQAAPVGQLEAAEPDLPIVSVLAGDLDGDGMREIMTARGWPQTWIERADPSGAFVSALFVPSASGPASTADLAGDGALALALQSAAVRDPLGAPCLLTYAEPDAVRRFAVGDFDGDGRDDVVFLAEHEYTFGIARLPAP